ncbi:MAG: response regulator transcription factor [Gammaproteobacteria bacterium]|nr:MAG: response regulator transcription factor [Gammaproteobacteria bacterium]
MRVLVIEDDIDVARQVADTLRQAMYVVDIAHDGEEGQFLGDTETYDVVLLDIGLPKRDGLSVLQHWRRTGRDMPVLILTARDTWREKVAGLRAGADDYLAKPFELEEMLARVEALIRRSAGHASPVIEAGPLALDVSTARLTVAGRPVELTALEFRTLAHLMQNSERIVSKTELTEHLYEQDFDRDSNVIEVLINRLRKKVGAELIKTHRGLGYQFLIPGEIPGRDA